MAWPCLTWRRRVVVGYRTLGLGLARQRDLGLVSVELAGRPGAHQGGRLRLRDRGEFGCRYARPALDWRPREWVTRRGMALTPGAHIGLNCWVSRASAPKSPSAGGTLYKCTTRWWPWRPGTGRPWPQPWGVSLQVLNSCHPLGRITGGRIGRHRRWTEGVCVVKGHLGFL